MPVAMQLGSVNVTDAFESRALELDPTIASELSLREPGLYRIVSLVSEATGEISQPVLVGKSSARDVESLRVFDDAERPSRANEGPQSSSSPTLENDMWTVTMVDEARLRQMLLRYDHDLVDGVTVEQSSGKLVASRFLSLGLETISESFLPASSLLVAPALEPALDAALPAGPLDQLVDKLDAARSMVNGVGEPSSRNDGVKDGFSRSSADRAEAVVSTSELVADRSIGGADAAAPSSAALDPSAELAWPPAQDALEREPSSTPDVAMDEPLTTLIGPSDGIAADPELAKVRSSGFESVADDEGEPDDHVLHGLGARESGLEL